MNGTAIDVKKVSYGGWPNCFRIRNALVDLVVTTDVGPRVIRFGFIGGPNEFMENLAELGQTGGESWRVYGGHRLWHAPEVEPRTYAPDNGPVKLEPRADGVLLVQPVEPTTGIQKEIEVRLASDAAHVAVTHRLRNAGPWRVEFAPWALTVMAAGGTAIVPLPPRGSHPEDLPPGNALVLWKYTDMTDPRWTWGRKYILLRQDSAPMTKPQKLGAAVPDGWIGYVRDGHLFVKTFQHDAAAVYPDFGCSAETFTNKDMLELETLGPLVTLAPGATIEHLERWSLFRDVPTPRTDADVDAHVLPNVKTIRSNP